MGPVAVVERLSNLCAFELPIVGGTPLAQESELRSDADTIIVGAIAPTMVAGISGATIGGTAIIGIATSSPSSQLDSTYDVK